MLRSKKRKRIFIIVISVLTGLILIISTGLFIYALEIDYSFDDELFEAAKTTNITKIYYNKAGSSSSLEDYEAGLYEELAFMGITREWCKYEDIADTLKNSFIAMEDRDFFNHNGINIKRTLGALGNYVLHFRDNFGGSTITQQLVKNITGDNERSAKRKLTEIFRAIYIDNKYTKEEIFELYMGVVSMGENIVGVARAAEVYFGKSANELSYAEAATLVGIANAPSRYNPRSNPSACLEKRNKVLYSLKDCGYLSANEYESEIKKPLGVIAKAEANGHGMSWFAESLIKEVSRDLADKNGISVDLAEKYILSSGVKIYSTVSPKIQQIVSEYFENSENFSDDVSLGLQYSMVISEPYSGNLLACAGGVGRKTENRILNFSEVNITPGSTLKPLALYAPLIEKGKINWATVFDDVPLTFTEAEGGEFICFPHNSPNIYDGLITVKDALRVSKNTVAVRLYELLGANSIYINLKNNYRFDTLVKKEKTAGGAVLTDLATSPLALGQLTHGVSLRKLTEAYNVFPNEGKIAPGRSYLAVFDAKDRVILEKNTESKRVMATETARIMNKMLEEVVSEGTAKRIKLNEYFDIAGKTGTSGNDRDRLFIGYTPGITAGIWCGYSGRKESIGAQEISHLDIWNDIIDDIYKTGEYLNKEEHFSVSGLERLPFCLDSGKQYMDSCIYDPRGKRLEYGYFYGDNKPDGYCERHVMCKYDVLTEAIAHDGCNSENIIDISLIKVEDRNFPCEIIINDAEYVWRRVRDTTPMPSDYTVPFFFFEIEEGSFAGRSRGKKQYNSYCYLHDS